MWRHFSFVSRMSLKIQLDFNKFKKEKVYKKCWSVEKLEGLYNSQFCPKFESWERQGDIW